MKNENYILHEFDEAAHKIVNEGFDIEDDRTGIGTRCLFGISTKYDISKRVPIPTKRKVNWQSILKEVLWYISGSSNINDLENMGSKIWTPWKNNKFTDALDTINSIKSSSIEKLGLTEKILKLEYIIYNKINDKKNMERIIMQIREYDPNFKDENN